MPLTAIANGQATDASQLNQLINALTGVLTDQPFNLGNVLKVSGGSASTDAAIYPKLAAGYVTPQAGRLIFGDGSGWKFSIARGTAAAPVDLLTIQDNGQIVAANTLSIGGAGGVYATGASGLDLRANGSSGAVAIGYNQGVAGTTIFYGGSTTALLTIGAGAAGAVTIANGLTVSAGGIAGTLLTAAQPNITSLGTLSSLTVGGTISGTILTAAQPNITSLGTLTSLALSGALTSTVTDLNLGGATGGNVRAFTKYRMRVKNNTNTVVGTSWTKINLALIDYDPNSNFNTTTSTYTVPSAGYYLIIGKFTTYSIPAGIWFESAIFKNGVEVDRDSQSSGSITSDNANVVGIYLLAANDAITLNAAVSSGTVSSWSPDGSSFCSLTVHFLSAP